MRRKSSYCSHRNRIEKMKQKTWLLIVIAKFLSILDWLFHHWR